MRRLCRPIVAFLCLAAGACGGASGEQDGADAAGTKASAPAGPAATPPTVAEALAASPDQAEFARLLEVAGLAGTFRGLDPYTVFAPTDAAFAALPENVRSGLEAESRRERLVTLLSYHVVPGTVTTAGMEAALAQGAGGRAELTTVTGASLSLRREGGTIVVEDATGARARIVAPGRLLANGVVHGIDTVLVPSG